MKLFVGFRQYIILSYMFEQGAGSNLGNETGGSLLCTQAVVRTNNHENNHGNTRTHVVFGWL